MWLFIRPLDTICCRDGRPFTAGEGVMAKTMFPPLPSTFYGAIRSAILANNGKSFNEFQDRDTPYDDLPEVGTAKQQGNLSISGPCLAEKPKNSINYDFYFPSPAHFVEEKEIKDNFHKLIPVNGNIESNMVSDLKIPINFIKGPRKVVNRFDGYLNFNGTQKLLWSETKVPEKKDTCHAEVLFRTLWQVGLKRTLGKRTAEEGQLYSMGHYQMTSSGSSGFYIKVKGLTQDLRPGILKLGGEWRAATYEKSDQPPFHDNHMKQITDLIFHHKRFFLWLITPAVFKHGLLPGFLDKSSLKGILKKVLVRLTTCQTIQKKYIGGFRLGKGGDGKSKTGYYAVPAGSVYFFDLVGDEDRNTISDFVKNQMFETMEGQLDSMAQQGFGTTLIGGF